MKRPDCIRHWRELEGPDDATYPDSPERFSIGAPLGRGLRLNRLGIHHERLPPGRRTSYPHAESDEEEFIYVLEGYPEVWINGYLWKLEPGDSVGFPAGTGICHTFSITPSRKFVCWWWARPTRSTTAFITRSIPAMPRRARIVGLTIRRSSSVHTTASRGKSNHFR